MSDSTDMLRYDKMVENALRGVVKKAVENVIEDCVSNRPTDGFFFAVDLEVDVGRSKN